MASGQATDTAGYAGNGWRPIHLAPRDGTPVLLWMTEHETPPKIPDPVGFWVPHSKAGVGYWRLFGQPLRFCSDRQVRSWRPILGE